MAEVLLAVADGDVLEIEISKTHSDIFLNFDSTKIEIEEARRP